MQGTERTKKRTAEMIWLQYFNEKLFEQKKIDETARTKDIAECFGTLFFCALTGVLQIKQACREAAENGIFRHSGHPSYPCCDGGLVIYAAFTCNHPLFDGYILFDALFLPPPLDVFVKIHKYSFRFYCFLQS